MGDALGKVNSNLNDLIQSQGFRDQFALNTRPIQSNVMGQMKDMGKQEASIAKNLNKTEDRIAKLKRQGGGNFITGTLIPLGFTILGGILLITLARMALRKWADAFMPKPEPGTATILGVPIPGLATLKAIGLGVWNFITVGLPNAWDRIKAWWQPIRKKLFGKGGMFSSWTETVNTLRKIAMAMIIGWTKKAIGGVLSFIAPILALVLNCIVPGSGIIVSIVCKLLPEIIAFIATQVALWWSNKKADAEVQLANLKKMDSSKALLSKLKSAGSAVKPLVPAASIPGLETPKGGPGASRKPAAIVRRMRNFAGGQLKATKATQEDELEKENKEAEEGHDAKYGEFKGKSLAKAIAKGDKSLRVVDYLEYGSLGSAFADTAYKKAIEPEVNRIDAWIDVLKKSKRFQGVTGLLYDPVTGWNPGYNVLAEDLRTPIPLEPFARTHEKADIQFGSPGGASEDYIGRMPFTWEQNGTVVTANPIAYELHRAEFIKGMWVALGRMMYNNAKEVDESGHSSWDGAGGIMTDIRDYMKDKDAEWRSYNHLTASRIGERADVNYGDRFQKFLVKFRAGEVKDSENTMETAGQDTMGDAWDRGDLLGVATNYWKGGVELSTTVLSAPAKAVAAVGKTALLVGKKLLGADDKSRREWAYDEKDDGKWHLVNSARRRRNLAQMEQLKKQKVG